jgi:hypothetical protein
MCTPAALETALRGAMRKQDGIDCVAIAVDASSYFINGDKECGIVPIVTRLSSAIVGGLVVVNVSAESSGDLIECDEQQGIETIMQGLLYPSDDPAVNVLGIWQYVGESACPEDCEDDAVGLAERIKGSLVSEVGFTPYALRTVEGTAGDPLDCDDVTPTETLLRSAFVRQSDGGWALRIVVEA